MFRTALVALSLIVLLALAFWIGSRMGGGRRALPPAFHQLTFRRGTITSARFAPDGQTIIYSAAWDDNLL